MNKPLSDELNWFLAKAALFVFINALGVYLFLQLFNVYSDGFIAVVFNIKIPLAVAIVSGFVFMLTYSGNDNKPVDHAAKPGN